MADEIFNIMFSDLCHFALLLNLQKIFLPLSGYLFDMQKEVIIFIEAFDLSTKWLFSSFFSKTERRKEKKSNLRKIQF